MKKYSSIFLLCLATFYMSAQHLERHSFIGIVLDSVSDDVARVMKLTKGEGVLITRVLPGSTAESAGLKKGDVILRLADSLIISVPQMLRIARGIEEGQKVPYTLNRGGKIVSSTFIVMGLPYEKYEGADVIYGDLKSGTNLLRTIINKPALPGRMPAVLFVQGIGCYSMDSPLDTDRAEIKLFHQFTRNGFVVMRVDKSGTGDSRGTPCDQLDFNTELEGYKQAFDALKKLDYVDTAKCFIVGHSMGGVMAPMIAKENPTKGIIAYGTIGANFMEYWIDTRRTIADAYGMNPADKDDYIKEQCQCAALLLDANMTREEVQKINPNCKETMDVLLLRDYSYWRQLMTVNIPALWQNYTGKLLSMWGSADYISSREENKALADIVNMNHPGNAVFREVPDAAHSMKTATSFTDALNNQGGLFNTDIGDMMSDWLKQHTN